MVIELYWLLEVAMIIFFFLGYFRRNEFIWVLTLVLAAVLMVSSFNIEYVSPVYDPNIGAYAVEKVQLSYPSMMGINMMFFAIAMIYFWGDLLENHGGKIKEKWFGDATHEHKR